MANLGDPARLENDVDFRKFLKNNSNMSSLEPSLGAEALTDIRKYLWKVRNTYLTLNTSFVESFNSSSYDFPTQVFAGESSSETLTLKITNLRRFKVDYTLSLDSNSFTATSNCSPNSVAAAVQLFVGSPPVVFNPPTLTVQSCEVYVRFTPPSNSTAGPINAKLTLTLTFAGQLPTSGVAHKIGLSGTSSGPRAPHFVPSGFLSLASFSAPTNGAQTLCPTIGNSGSANLTLGFSVASAVGSGSNDSNYFELAPLMDCPSGSPPLCVSPPPTNIQGNATLAASGGSCTLALKFNPAKFGFAGGNGVRSARLLVAHNAPAGTVAEFILAGNPTAGPQPQIGIFTDPAVAGGHVSPPAFANQVVKTSSAIWNAFLIFNNGSADGLDLTEVTSSNTEFSLSEDCVGAAPLARKNSSDQPRCTVALRFTPTTLGERCTTVTVRAAFSSNGAQSLKVCGTGVPLPVPLIQLSRDTIGFGSRSINALYPPESILVSNAPTATANLLIANISLEGTGFVLLPDVTRPCLGATLTPGASCAVHVQFVPDPTRPEVPYSALLHIDSNDPASLRRSVSLTAIARAAALPVLKWDGGTTLLKFPNFVLAGQQSELLTATLRNVGPGAVAVQSVRLFGADAPSFSVSSCPPLLQQDETCAVNVRFIPGSGGVKEARFEVISSGVAPPLLSVKGRAVGGNSPYLTVSAPSLAFGSVRVGANSTPLELRIASGGDGAIRITSIAVAGPYIVQSKTCPVGPFTLLHGSDCVVTVTFTPSETQSATGVLRITSDADTRPLEVPLAGIGEQPAKVSGGGCSIATGNLPADSTLWILVLLAVAALFYRYRVARTTLN